MVIEVMSAILRVSARGEEKADEVAAEAKTLLKRYLAPYELAGPQPPNGPLRRREDRTRKA
jgi:hypothetical protein